MEAGMYRRAVIATGVATGVAAAVAIATLAFVSQAAMAEVRDGAYRGMIVCEKLKNSPFILRAPLDISVSGKAVIAVRPIFNIRGTRVVASEIATGTVADDGSIKFSSNWHGGGTSFEGSYSGVIGDKSGTLIGMQNWTTAAGKETRNCSAAFVQVRS
jgi:hypothetical protein